MTVGYDMDAPLGVPYERAAELAADIRKERAEWIAERGGHPIIVWGGDRVGPAVRIPDDAEWGQWASNLTWTVVYRFFTEQGRLLYVGISNRPDQRYTEHIASAVFTPHAAMVYEQWFSTRSGALRFEADQIDRYSPPYNRDRRSETGGPRSQLTIDTPQGRAWHPHERHEEIAARIVSAGRRVMGDTHPTHTRCWHCASSADLSASLEGRPGKRAAFDPTVPSALCPRWNPKRAELPTFASDRDRGVTP